LSNMNNNYIVRVVFFEPYPMGLGGNFLTQRMILERLDRERFYPVIMAPMDGVALDRFRAMGVECVVIPPSGALGRYGGAVLRAGVFGRLKSAIDLVRYNLHLARFFRTRKINLVYANCVRAQLSVGLAAWLLRIPVFLYVKGELSNPLIDRLAILSAKKVGFMCDFALENARRLYRRLIDGKYVIVRGGIDLPDIECCLEGGEEDPAVVFDRDNLNTVVIGQTYPLKNQMLALEAFARVAEEFPSARLYVIGDPVLEDYRPYLDKLKTVAARSDLDGRVFFLPWSEKIYVLMACADILVNPSNSEGFGYVVIEAMALGLPVVATRTGVVSEAIRDSVNGFSVAIGDCDAMADRWRELLSSPELRQRLGKEAQRTIFADYLIDDKVAHLSEIWSEMAVGE
jgi:glycosyltransferase involved in cell wall biosynthesis